MYLIPSNYTPPEPPELPEPAPFFQTSGLVGFVRDLSAPGAWEDPMSMEARGGLLIVRNQPAVLEGVAALLEQVRREVLWSVTTRLEVVEMPRSLLDDLQRDGHGVLILATAQRAAVDAALSRGAARRLAQLELRGHAGRPNAISSGRHVLFLQDYAVEIAEQSSTANPVVQSFFAGLRLDVTATRTSGDGSVALDVRATRSTHVTPMRRMETRLGPLELPQLGIFRIWTGLLVPLGSSVLLASEGDGRTRRVMLLTPTVHRRR